MTRHTKKQLRASEQDRLDVAEARRHWRIWQRYMDSKRFVFLDGSKHCFGRGRHEHDPPLRLGTQKRAPGRRRAVHKVAGVREAIRATGASPLYLPPYSPDLNPLEQAFAKLKALLRKAAARTREDPWSTIGQLLSTFTPDKCRNYLANSG